MGELISHELLSGMQAELLELSPLPHCLITIARPKKFLVLMIFFFFLLGGQFHGIELLASKTLDGIMLVKTAHEGREASTRALP